MPKVSVLTPVYGVEKYIRKCVNSLFCQTLQDVEYIFVDDCTPNGSVAVIKEVLDQFPNYRSKVNILHHLENRGSAAARNTALEAASGDYIIVIDGDDYIESTMLEDLYNMAIKENADIVISDYWIDYKNKIIYKKQFAPSVGMDCLKDLLNGKLHASTSNKLIAKKLFIENNIEHVEGVNVCEDMSILFRLFYYAKKVAYCPHAYLHYVQYNTSSYTKRLSERVRQNIISVVDLIYDFFINNNVRDKDLWQAFEYYKLTVKSILLISSGRKEREKYYTIYNDSVQHLNTHPGLAIYYKWIVRMASENNVVRLSSFLFLFNIIRRWIK